MAPAASHRSAMRISTAEKGVPRHGRSKRSSISSREDSEDVCSHPTWVILHRVGGRRDLFGGDRTTSAVSRTSSGERISVSFELARPPRTSLLTLDWPCGPDPAESTLSYPYVVAADRDAVLLEVVSDARYPHPAAVDRFVYRASGEPSPCLTRLPVCYWKGRSGTDSPRPCIMSREGTGLLSCGEGSFVVADIERRPGSPSAVTIYLLCSGLGDWKVFRDVPICHAGSVVPNLCWWSTDAVLPCRNRRCLIWVDYYRGMIVADMAHPGNGRRDPQQPLLRYVPLPVDPLQGNPYKSSDYGRGCPEASRSLCVTSQGIKFVSVDKHGGGGSFSITLSTLCENQEWREDATMDAGQLWDLDSENSLPHVYPEFPVVNMENPNSVCFLLSKGRHTADSESATWMIEVHMKKKILLDFTPYYKKGSSSSKKGSSVRTMSVGLSLVSSEMPCYLSRQAMKRRLRS